MGMGQVTLGLRSLAIKLAVFVVLAALLAWVLGGTLWPRPSNADMPGVPFAGQIWFWRLSVGGDQPGIARWKLMRRDDDRAQEADARSWCDVASLVTADEKLCYGGLLDENGAKRWRVESRDRHGAVVVHPMPDRLAVEQQLSRVMAGLPIQDAATIAAQRAAVLDPVSASMERNSLSDAAAP